uniref:Neurensin 1 n=1 Tax=Sinocyclocheilus anshuiensis TaxID=1608454 RepID=A0A671SH09_9TELE
MTSCSEICGSDYTEQSHGALSSGYQGYGVRSYLHQFYEECTASIWERDEDFQTQRSLSRWSSVLWKVSCILLFPLFSSNIYNLSKLNFNEQNCF